jgi:hypothetical protein
LESAASEASQQVRERRQWSLMTDARSEQNGNERREEKANHSRKEEVAFEAEQFVTVRHAVPQPVNNFVFSSMSSGCCCQGFPIICCYLFALLFDPKVNRLTDRQQTWDSNVTERRGRSARPILIPHVI